MKDYAHGGSRQPDTRGSTASDQLHIAVTFKGAGAGPIRLNARLSSTSVADFAPRSGEVEQAIEALKAYGFVVSGRGNMTLSVRGTREQFEKAFGTQLSVFELPPASGYSRPAVYYPADGTPWQPKKALANLIDDAYIQWPHIYMGGKRRTGTAGARVASRKTKASGDKRAESTGNNAGRPTGRRVASTTLSGSQLSQPAAAPPKRVSPYLNVLKDVPHLLNVEPIHKNGGLGRGVRVAMIDTGFAHSHPFFVTNGFTSSVVLAPGASFRDTDPRSHGTGESANIFAVAPQVTFIGIKLEDDNDPERGASILEGFQEALRHKPHVISVSMGYDLRALDGRSPLSILPNGLKALELEIQAAVAQGIVVVFSAGNGHYSFPGQMPEVIAAGGAYVGTPGALIASDYASAFKSGIYSGRTVPDVCGLVGPRPHADYIMLPVPAASDLDRSCAEYDGTMSDDGWAAFSGTSAAAPQIAAACALLLQKNPNLSPAEIKALLMRTALDVREGRANPASDPAEHGLAASSGRDGATGAGLIDAFSAWQQA